MNNVFFVNVFKNIEGGEIFLKNLANGIAEKNIFNCYFLQDALLPSLESAKIKTIAIKTVSRTLSLKLILEFFGSILSIRMQLKKTGDFVILNGERAIYMAPFLPRSCKYICVKHMLIEGKNKAIKRFLFFIVWIFVHKVITVSKYHVLNLQQHLPKFIKRKISHIYYGVDCENYFQPIDLHQNNEVVILMVGTFMQRKGQLDLLDAYSRIEQKANTKLLLVGGGTDFEKIQEKIKCLNLNDLVEIHDFNSNVLQFYQRASIFVLPSYSEGLPISLLEAQACGLPVISTRIAGTPELITDGENGFIIEAGDIGKLKERLQELIENEGMRHKMGMNGRKIVQQNFSRNRSTQEYLALLNN